LYYSPAITDTFKSRLPTEMDMLNKILVLDTAFRPVANLRDEHFYWYPFLIPGKGQARGLYEETDQGLEHLQQMKFYVFRF